MASPTFPGLRLALAALLSWSLGGSWANAADAAARPAEPSAGCAAPARRRLQTGNHTIVVEDPLLGKISRQFLLHVPSPAQGSDAGADPTQGLPLVLGFHGQGDNPWNWQNKVGAVADLAARRGWVAVFPAGFHEDTVTGSSDSGWNCGTAADDSTCLPGTTSTQCMKSCHKLGQCGRCTWTTCYDDIEFVKQLLRHLEQGLCLDPARYFALGESNGAMFTHYLVQELPGRFRAAAPVFGSPAAGYLVGSRYQLVAQQALARRTSMLQLHDRSDVTIPWQGGNSSDGWLFEPMQRSVGAWAAVHRCAPAPVPVQTAYDGGAKHLECMEFMCCGTGGRAMYCFYDGGHGDWPDQPRAANLIWSFFESVSGGEKLAQNGGSLVI